MRLTVPHYVDFGADREHVGNDLVRPEAWDALRLNTSGPFSLPGSRREWEQLAAGWPQIRVRAERIAAIARGRGVRRLASYGAGSSFVELWMHRAAPEIDLILTDYAPATVDRIASVFPEARTARHDLLADAPLEADLHLFHRVDTEFTNRQWRAILRRFAAVPVLVVASEVIDLHRARKELGKRFKAHERNLSRAGWLRTRGAFEALYGREHELRRVSLVDLEGWMLEPRR